VRRPPLAHDGEQRFGLFACLGVPHAAGRARVHQRQPVARHEAVVDEAVFLDREPRVALLQVPGAVVLDAMTQDQVLCSRRRAHRVGLHEPQALERAGQRGRLE